MNDFLSRSIEVQNWGWNILTVGAVGTVVLTPFQVWGLWKQARAIWGGHSGKSISIPMLGFQLVYFGAFLIYAWSVPSVAMVLNCILMVPIAFGVAGLLRYKWHHLAQWGIVVFLGGFIPAMIYLPKEIVLGALYVPLFGVLLHQGYEVWRNGPGVIDPTFVKIFIITGVFWIAFTFAAGEWIIFFFNCLAAPVWIYIFWKWRKTRVV